MINLLPPIQKIALQKEQNRKLVLVLGFLLLVSLLCFVLVLLSLYFYIMVQVSYQKSLLDDAKQQYQTKDFLQYTDIINQSNQALVRANAFYKKEVFFSGALVTISNISRPDGVRFKNITMQRGSGRVINVNVAGTSDTRENLLLFKASIEGIKEISNAYFPPEDWIKSKDVNFYFTFDINEKLQ